MPIISIRKKIKIFAILIFIFSFSGCGSGSSFHKAKRYSQLSKDYYRKAIGAYEKIIRSGKANDEIYLNLGKLYFENGDFLSAIDAFKRCSLKEAKKYLGISYYKVGDLTEALKIFDSLGILEDDFYLYHYGLVCEGLNLYEQAKSIYQRIKKPPYYQLAKQNLSRIEEISSKESLLDLNKFFSSKFSRQYYPEAGALFLKVDEEIEITEENTSIYTGHFIIKILDERGKEDFSEVIINYDSTYEKPYLEFARTIKEDGTSVSVGKKHIRDVSRYLNFPLYSNARALIISMPEVTVGCIIEYKFKVFKNQLIDKKNISLSYFLQENEPIIEANFSVILPEDRILNIKTLNERYNRSGALLNPEILKEKNKIKYIWKFKDIPQIIPEPNMPDNVEVNPIIIISTFSSWDKIYDWWWGLAKDKIKASKPIKEIVQRLIKDAKNDEEKARVIYNFCARNIRYVAVAYGQAGYEPHFAEEIFLNKYGDCKDQSILLVTMLREAGLKAYPVLIGTQDYFNLYPDFPSVLFNHCIVMVELERGSVFLDPTCTTCSFGDLPADDQERKVLVFKDDGFEIKETFLSSFSHNKIISSLKIKLENDETIMAEKRVIPFGLYNQIQRAWFLYSQPEMIRQSIEKGIQDISTGAKLENYNIENLEEWGKPVILKYDFKGPFSWISAGDLRILPQLSELAVDLVAKEKRNYPLKLGLPTTEEKEIIFEFPSDFVVTYLPENIHVNSAWIEFIVEYAIKDKTLYFKQKKINKQMIVDPEDYPEFRKFYQELFKRIKQRVVFKKINK
jgi:tetratricopeptide (TPR) repeat protein